MFTFTTLARKASASLLLTALALLPLPQARAYSVQTHEQIIDLTWGDSIRPLLLARYPGLTSAQLDEAHAYAYGGSAIQDLGYYPFGKPFFSDLTHYVRSGDFVKNLLRDARNANELAFAIGALSHYVGDTIGHSRAVNLAVAIEFPKLGRKYGPSVAYDKNEHAHVRTEFGFDINEISKHRFAPSAYLKHVGLKVPGRLLEQAFYETYGLDQERILGKRRPTIRGYRYAVRSLLPRVAYAEVALHRRSLPPYTPSPALDTLNNDLAHTEFIKQWDQFRKKAGPGTHLLAGFIFVLPKFGPLSDLAIKVPNPQTEQSYIESVNRSTALMRQVLAQLRTSSGILPNRDLDTGQPTRPGGYRLTDETYAKLLSRITALPDNGLPLGLKQDILAYYANPDAPISTKKNPRAWQQVQSDLVILQNMPTRGLALEAQDVAPGTSPAASGTPASAAAQEADDNAP